MTRARLSSVELGRRAGVGASWVRQVQSGRIAKPAPDKLGRVATELGLELEPLLAMSDQLGAAAEVRRVQPTVVTVEAIEEATRRANQPLVDAIAALVEEMRLARREQAEWTEGVKEAAAELAALRQGSTPTDDPSREHPAGARQ